MRTSYWLFELDDPNATDADYENGEGKGSYSVWRSDGTLIGKVDTLEEAEALIEIPPKTDSGGLGDIEP